MDPFASQSCVNLSIISWLQAILFPENWLTEGPEGDLNPMAQAQLLSKFHFPVFCTNPSLIFNFMVCDFQSQCLSLWKVGHPFASLPGERRQGLTVGLTTDRREEMGTTRSQYLSALRENMADDLDDSTWMSETFVRSFTSIRAVQRLELYLIYMGNE